MSEELIVQKERISLPPPVAQLIIREHGHWGGDQKGADLFHLSEIIALFVGCIDNDELLKKKWEEKGRSWSKLLEIRNRAQVDGAIMKGYLSKISDKSGENKEKEKKEKAEYNMAARRISPFTIDLVRFYNMCLRMTNIEYMTIPNDAFRVSDPQSAKVWQTKNSSDNTGDSG